MRRPLLSASGLHARLFLAASVVVAAWIAPTGQTPPTDPAQADALARRAAARIEALRREADALATRERTLLDDLRKLDVERALQAERVAQVQRELDRLQADIAATAGRRATLERASRAQLSDLTARLVELYKLGNGGYLRLLLSVDDLRDMGRAYRFVAALQQVDRQRVRDHQRTLADLRATEATLVQRRTQVLQAQDDVVRARTIAERAAIAHEDLIRRIDGRRDLAAQFMGELEIARQKLQRTLDESSRGGPAAGALPALPLRPFKGDLDWPADGRVVGAFGRQQDRRFHTAVVSNGIRIAAAPGATVRAIHEGTVAFAEPFSGFGNLVIVDHGGLAFSLYGYLADIAVSAGSRVARGQGLGTVGTALDGTPALYFELRIDGKPADPVQWLKQQ